MSSRSISTSCARRLEEVVEQSAGPILDGKIEVESAVEPARAQKSGVERVGTVRGTDDQDVVYWRTTSSLSAGLPA